jgi:hemolysin D
MPGETEFLPAALEIARTPPPWSVRATVWVVLTLFAVVLAWSVTARVDITAVARGRIVPSGRVKVVQPFESGIVREILVRDGERVRAGQALLRLDPTLPAADVDQLRGQHSALAEERQRLKAVLAHIGTGPGNTVATGDPDPSGSPLLRARISAAAGAILAEQAALGHELLARRSERRAATREVLMVDGTLPLITQRASSLRSLADRGLLPRTEWLEVEELRIAQTGRRDVARGRVDMLDADIRALELRIRARWQEVRARLLDELARVEQQLASARQEETRADRRLAWQTLSAPVSGAVHGLAVHTVGAVVTPAQELLRIVPTDSAMEAETWIRNQDIGFVRAGDPVAIKIDTFPFTKYGVIHGEIIGIAADAVSDDRQGPVYAARVRLGAFTFVADGASARIAPGMTLTAEIRIGERRIIEFALAPLLRYRDEALRER